MAAVSEVTHWVAWSLSARLTPASPNCASGWLFWARAKGRGDRRLRQRERDGTLKGQSVTLNQERSPVMGLGRGCGGEIQRGAGIRKGLQKQSHQDCWAQM